MNSVNSKTILFITGAFVSNSCWDEWKIYFTNSGYTCIAPPWPYKEGTAEELRKRQPNDIDLAKLTLSELVDYYAAIVKGCAEKPIAIGHSLGGLITQILVNRDLVAAGIAIHSVPPKGIIPYEFTFLKGGWKSLGLFTDVK
jgi:pimeloyl-ACP methyl ester carboxylesterase